MGKVIGSVAEAQADLVAPGRIRGKEGAIYQFIGRLHEEHREEMAEKSARVLADYDRIFVGELRARIDWIEMVLGIKLAQWIKAKATSLWHRCTKLLKR